MSDSPPESPKRRATYSEGLPTLKRNRKYVLQQIAEEADEDLIDDKAGRRASTPIFKNKVPKPLTLPKAELNVSIPLPPSEEPVIEPKKRSKSVASGFRMLKSFPGVTNHLITKADRAAFMKRKRRFDESKVERKPLRHRSPLLPSLNQKLDMNLLANLHPGLIEKMKGSILPKIKAATALRQISKPRERQSSSSSSARESAERSDPESSPSRSNLQSRTVSRLKRGRMKSKFASNLDKNNENLKLIFKTICKHGERGLKKVTSASFKSFLAVRYPDAFIDNICKHFTFSDGLIFDAYIGEFERFLSVNDDRLLHFVFDVFDTNRDHYLCYADTFQMISQRKGDYYDRDLLKLRQMFYLKKSRNAPGRKQGGGRRNSFFNAIGEDEESRAKRKKVPYYNHERPEALTFEDFSRVEFGGKPQFLSDFLKYTCAITIQEANMTTNSMMSRQNTEDVLAEASLSLSALNMLAKDERANYYRELQDVISQFSHAESQVIMSKFLILKASGTAQKMLSRDSVKTNFANFFGVDCDYIAERFFEGLSGRKNATVTKPRFCRQILKLIRGNNFYKTKWAFKLYDADRDGLISVDELYDMQVNLPPDSLAYKECSLLVSLVVKSLLSATSNKRRESFDIESFTEIVPESCIVNEFIEALTDPSPAHVNKSFETPKKVETMETQPLKVMFMALVKQEVSLADILKAPQKE